MRRNLEHTLSESLSQMHDLENQISKINNIASVQPSEIQLKLESEVTRLSSERNTQVQSLQTDVLVMWNNLKQMDAAKAERNELEARIREAVSQAINDSIRPIEVRTSELERAVETALETNSRERGKQSCTVLTQTDSPRSETPEEQTGSLGFAGPSSSTIATNSHTKPVQLVKARNTSFLGSSTNSWLTSSSIQSGASQVRRPPLSDGQLHARGFHTSPKTTALKKRG